MTRFQFMLVPGLRSRCRSCGQELRLRMSRAVMLVLILAGAILGGIVVLFLEGGAFWLGLLGVMVIGLVLDSLMWRRVPWQVVDVPATDQAIDG